ncbi:glycosyltransferase family 39 protein [Cerasicoccus frondis]|uniref:glycosyltransferase family 39 protein n=1 Tax=Cerasicoccus frondis TaxID=490090 RepID=UPI0028528AA2|nr:glycosyltransferase family 39 protein [Cerasicoccus frondis]
MISALASLLKTTINSKGQLWRLGAFAALGFAALYFGFFHFSAVNSVVLMKHYGYYFMLASVLAFCAASFMAVRSNRTELCSWLKANFRWQFFFTLTTLTLYLWFSQELGFKVLMDEINLLGTSMRLHYDNVAMSPLRGYEINGVFLPLDYGFVDKRPLLFPFLVSLIHDATGYRPENGIYFNLALIPITLSLVYTLGLIFTNRLGGLLSMILLASFPMFNLCCHGGGFEGLNLFLILLTMLSSYLYLRRPEPNTLSLLCLSTVLLANVRYESVLFILPVAFVIALGYLREKKIIFSAGLFATPILLLPVPLLHRVFDITPEASWQLVSKDAQVAFGLEYLPRNAIQALAMFLDTSHQQPTSPFLAIFGAIGVILLLFITLRDVKNPGPLSAARVTLLSGCIGVGALMLLLLFYFWDFDDVVTRRLALPIVILMIFPGVSAIGSLFKSEVAMRLAIALALLVLLVKVVPRNAKDIYTKEYIPGQVIQWKKDFIKDHADEYNLVIDSPGFWITHEVSAIARERALNKKELLKFHLKNRTFDNILVVENYNKDIWQGVLRGGDDSRISDEFKTEVVDEKIFNGVVLVRIVRVLDIDVELPETLQQEAQEFEMKDLNRDDILEFQKIQQVRLSDLLP